MTSDLRSWLQIWSHDCRSGVMNVIWSHDSRAGVMTSDLKSWLQIWSHDSRSGVMNVIWSHDSRAGVMTSDLKSWLQIWSHDSRSGVMTSDLESWLQIWSHDFRSGVMTSDLKSWLQILSCFLFSLGIINSSFRSAWIKKHVCHRSNTQGSDHRCRGVSWVGETSRGRLWKSNRESIITEILDPIVLKPSKTKKCWTTHTVWPLSGAGNFPELDAPLVNFQILGKLNLATEPQRRWWSEESGSWPKA